jgi:hypothetical protein
MVDWYYIFFILGWGVYPSPQSIYNVGVKGNKEATRFLIFAGPRPQRTYMAYMGPLVKRQIIQNRGTFLQKCRNPIVRFSGCQPTPVYDEDMPIHRVGSLLHRVVLLLYLRIESSRWVDPHLLSFVPALVKWHQKYPIKRLRLHKFQSPLFGIALPKSSLSFLL